MYHPTAIISPLSKIAENVSIGPYCIIHENAEIGEGTVLESHVVIHDRVFIGKNGYIGSGTVISAKSNDLNFWEPRKMPSYVTIGDNVFIQENCTLKGDIAMGHDVWLASHVVIHHGARIGNNCKIFSGAVLSAIPQDLKFSGEESTLVIGDRTVIRECATLNRGTKHRSTTLIGSDCLIMSYVHIAHDCIIGNNVILGNSVNMAGHVEIDDYAIIAGLCAIHQFVRIGKHVMVSGGSLIGRDIPPYIMAGRFPVKYEGVNRVGLIRRAFSTKQIDEIKDMYRILFCQGRAFSVAKELIESSSLDSAEKDEIVLFLNGVNRGIIKGMNGDEIDNS
jgi:UDP-N-acetylglucosamine acyltransferase